MKEFGPPGGGGRASLAPPRRSANGTGHICKSDTEPLVHHFFQVHGEENIPCNLTAQLIWREFFYCMAYENLNYNKMENNPICLRIPWYKDDEKLDKWTKVILVSGEDY